MEPASVDLSLWAITKVVLSAGIVSAAFTAAVNWLNDRRKDERSARYLALQVAAHLEDYARTCSEALVGNKIADVSGGHAGSWGPTPDLPPFPSDDAGWKILKPELAERCFAMRASIRAAQYDVAQISEMDDERAYSASMLYFNDIAIVALNLAAALRSEYKFDDFLHTADIKSALQYAVSGIVDPRKT